ncbi:MAG: nicotinate (nicotinamide) nucleotide adenylyltransferase [Oscillospiraceae bacterium]|nr:nicotinate (nicotinamide) nucleotide adenylyltransferase [Oscillospiraceae bacterium]
MIKQIGIYGGTFDPIHEGHRLFITQILDICKLDTIMIIPSNNPPHKKFVNITPFYHRYEMCHLAFKDIQNIIISDIEKHIIGLNYSINTLDIIKKQNMDSSIFLIMGSDMFLGFKTWYMYKKILKIYNLIVCCRKEEDVYKVYEHKKTFDSLYNIEIININIIDISSSQIRKNFFTNFNYTKKYLHKDVLNYIIRNELYGKRF